MPTLVQGRVIRAQIPIPDPQGRNPKPNRPLVVVTATADIEKSDRIQAIAITGEYDKVDADKLVDLPWGPNARTSLRKPSWAHCTWLVEIAKQDLEFETGFVKASCLEVIIAKMKALHPKIIQASRTGPTPTHQEARDQRPPT